MKRIFFSWQSDSPRNINHTLIQQCLKNVVKELSGQEEATLVCRVEDGVNGVPGAPELAATIFNRIDSADVYVADVTLCYQAKSASEQDRPAPNPNVLIELGYALHALQDCRVIMVLNEDAGKPNLLPFDLRHRRWPITYCLSETAGKVEVENVKRQLTQVLLKAVKDILQSPLPSEPVKRVKGEVGLLLAEVTESAAKWRAVSAENRVGDYDLTQKVRDVAQRYTDICSDISKELPSLETLERLNILRGLLIQLKLSLAGKASDVLFLAARKREQQELKQMIERLSNAKAKHDSFTLDLAKLKDEEVELNHEMVLLQNQMANGGEQDR